MEIYGALISLYIVGVQHVHSFVHKNDFYLNHLSIF